MADKSALKRFITWLAAGRKKSPQEKAEYLRKQREAKKPFIQQMAGALGKQRKQAQATTPEQRRKLEASKLKGARKTAYAQERQRSEAAKKVQLEAAVRRKVSQRKKAGKLVSPSDIAKIREQLRKSMNL